MLLSLSLSLASIHYSISFIFARQPSTFCLVVTCCRNFYFFSVKIHNAHWAALKWSCLHRRVLCIDLGALCLWFPEHNSISDYGTYRIQRNLTFYWNSWRWAPLYHVTLANKYFCCPWNKSLIPFSISMLEGFMFLSLCPISSGSHLPQPFW